MATGYTAYAAHCSKKASEDAKEAVESTRVRFNKLDTMSEFDAALSQVTYLKDLQRESAWSYLPYQHSLLKRTLVALKRCKPELDAEQKIQLQRGIDSLTKMQDLVEATLDNRTTDTLSVSTMNATLSDLETALAEMRTDIQNQLQVL